MIKPNRIILSEYEWNKASLGMILEGYGVDDE